MAQQEVRTAKLSPMRVAWHHYIGEGPEEPAIQGLIEWAAGKDLLAAADHAPRFFGFNNPSPKEGDPVYGYEFWIVVGEGMAGSGDVQVKDAPGGLYLVAAGLEAGWKWVHEHFGPWTEENGYQYDGERQWLEEHVPNAEKLDKFVKLDGDERWATIDVYLPIKPKG